MLTVWFVMTCQGEENIEKTPEEDSGSVETTGPTLQWSQQLTVLERPFDINFHPDGRIFCSAQSGDRIYTWNTNNINSISTSLGAIIWCLFN